MLPGVGSCALLMIFSSHTRSYGAKESSQCWRANPSRHIATASESKPQLLLLMDPPRAFPVLMVKL